MKFIIFIFQLFLVYWFFVLLFKFFGFILAVFLGSRQGNNNEYRRKSKSKKQEDIFQGQQIEDAEFREGEK